MYELEPSQGITWECGTDSGFVQYDEKDAYNLEKALLEGSTKVAVRNDKNEVDLGAMKQKNKSTGVLRDVRRKELPILMVSWARIGAFA
jgi:hypothetical protein